MNNTLAGLLEPWTSDTIKNYVYLLGGRSSISRKSDRINFVCQKMLDPKTLAVVWQSLDEIAKRAVSVAYHNGGKFDETAFVAQYDELPARPRSRRTYYTKEPIFFDLFIFNGTIPSDLMPLLTNLVLPVERFRLAGTEEPPQQVERWRRVWKVMQADTELVGRTDLLTYLQLVDQGIFKWSVKNNLLTAGSIRKVTPNLMAGGFKEVENITSRTVIRPFGLDVFTQEAGLVTRTGKLTSAGREYMQTQEPEIMFLAFEKWAEEGKFDELTRVARLKGLGARGTRLTSPASRRAPVIEALSWSPVNQWLKIEDFYRAIRVWKFDFDVESTKWGNLYVGASREYGQLAGNDYWKIVKGLYINAIIWEYLGTIGAVDLAYVDSDMTWVDAKYLHSELAYSLHDGLIAFRINNWGAYLLGQTNEYIPTQSRKKTLFTIDTDLKLQVLADLLPNEQLLVEMIANPIDDQHYQLDTVKLLTAIESGQSVDYLRDFLQENHQGDLPSAVTDWLTHLQKNQGQFREKGTATLIQVNQPDLITLAREDKQLAKLCRAIDDKTLLVPSIRLTRFRGRLKELGYLLG